MMRLRACLLLLSLVAAGACSADPKDDDSSDTNLDSSLSDVDDTPDDATSDADAGLPDDACTPASIDAEPETFQINGWSISIAADGAWSLTNPSGDDVLAGPGVCEQGPEGALPFARVGRGEPGFRSLFGAFDIRLVGSGSDIEWFAPRGRARLTEDSGSIALTWNLPEQAGSDATASLLFSARDEAHLNISLVTNTDTLNSGEFAMRCSPDESFFGLGSQTTSMDLRGGLYPLWTQEQGNGKPDDGGIFPINNVPEAAYAPMGVWHSSKGYAALIGHDAYSELDLCELHEDRVLLRSHQALPSMVLVAGDTPRDRMKSITDYTGRLDFDPPPWLFGPWVDAVDGPWRVQQVAETMRDQDISVSAIWTEDWIGSAPTTSGFRLTYEWTWDDQTYPNLPDTIDGLHRDGFAFLGYFNPFVPDTVSHFQEGVDEGYLITDEAGDIYTVRDPAARNASLIDLSNPRAVDWLKTFQTTAAADLGIDGWMADFAEWLPVDAQLDSEQSSWQFHNRYPVEWQRANREALEEAHTADEQYNWAYFARSGWASVNGGTPGVVPAMWGGDQDTDWAYDDGFPTIIPIGAHLGLSGIAIYGSDIAGYNSISTTNTSKELFFRWSAAGAFHPLMRTHHGGDKCDNWTFDQDDDTLSHFRRYAAIHTLLYPYFTGLLRAARSHGLPITRHPYLVEPDNPALWTGPDYQWFLGDDLLIAPVLRPGEVYRDVALPGQGWWPLFADAPLSDAPDLVIDAPVTETPVFVRPGTALPLLGDVVDSHYGADNPAYTDLDDVDGRYRLALYPDSTGDVATPENMPFSAIGSNWTDLDALDLGNAEVDDAPVGPCDDPVASPCYDLGAQVLIVDVEDTTTVALGSATLELQSAEPITVSLGAPTKIWGTWGSPTPFIDQTDDVSSWCDDKPDAP